ncbi:MAG: carboxypeptidase-like regulatory domain-containing protein [Acidobacteriota bacterium]
MNNLHRATRLTLSLSLLASLSFGQSSTAEITGVVTDTTGGVVPGAEVQVANVDTGEKRPFTTDRTGSFVVPQLLPGSYQVTVNKDGFRPFVRSGLILQVGQRARVDITLQIGSTGERIEVVSQTSLLDVTEASLGQVIENRKILDLPLNGRNILGLTALTTGVVPTSSFFGGGVPAGRAASLQAGAAGFSVNGGAKEQNDVMMDGAPLALCCQNQISFLPSIDSTQEFRVRTNMYDAQYGRTSGGLVTFASKSGTNELHGSLFEFLRNKALDSSNFFDNRSGIGKAPFVFNQFGGSIGGPIFRDKTFFFFNYEGVRSVRGASTSGRTPTPEERSGQFAELIYDPLTVRQSGTTFLRDPFPNRQIPSNRFDPVAVKLFNFYPQPTVAGGSAVNWFNNATTPENQDQINVRGDHMISATNRLFARVSVLLNNGITSNDYNNIASVGWAQNVDNANILLDDTMTLTPTFILSMRYGFTRQWNRRLAFSEGSDLTQYGWPASYSNARQATLLPELRPSGYLGLVRSTLFRRAADSHTFAGDATKIIGRHILKFGTDFRIYHTNWTDNTAAGGSFSFNTGFTRGPNAQSGGGGNSIASFLLGLPSSGSILVTQPFSATSYYDALYVQDDFRISSKLTINLGLRWEVETARTERYNRLSYFDTTVASPLASVSPGLQGGLMFPGVGGKPRTQHDTDWNNIGPRFGFAWNALPRTVLRGGYGITYSPIQTRYNGTTNIGFSSTTPYFSSLDGVTPVGVLSNPFPNGVAQPPGSADGLLTALGTSFASLVRPGPVAYNQQWSFNIQRELTPNLLFDAAYVGSKGTRLDTTLALDQLNDSYLGLGSALLNQLPNPFAPYVTAGALSNPTATRKQLLLPYPQFLGVSAHASIGSSIYHGLQLKLNRRFSGGFSILGSFTFGKLIDDTSGFQNVYNRQNDRGLDPSDISRRLVISYVWELPFGKGHRFLGSAPRAVDAILGGWQLNGISVFSTGFPIALGNAVSTTSGASLPNNNGQSAKKDGPVDQRLNQYFNTSVFSAPGVYAYGNAPGQLPDVRSDGSRNFDVSLFKNFAINERAKLQFRAEVFNIFNTPQFGAPNASFGNANFGVVGSQYNNPRDIQLALRLSF